MCCDVVNGRVTIENMRFGVVNDRVANGTSARGS